ncbi:precorrin-3B C(17)-methyltransferase [uncultured Cohaesibacter sp.]|uniref:precorrin-3B C(17)-methyltransferase n=1 Tax=uncultured Cohaesibacter sp. TaxID=1002546 RepID=UPI0029C7780C|nr:precorrin-3B C(17)-methyltransferase [uncultured Cohaesibacter sp.]
MEKLKPITIVCPSAAAGELAASISKILKGAGHPVELHGKGEIEGFDVSFSDSLAHLRSLFSEGRAIVALYASGIIIRALAPLLDSKFDEPPVLAVSRDGSSVVPLLGGHHGANDLAHLLADALKAHAAVTTAGDCRFRLALDNPPKGWKLQHAKKAAPLMARIIDGEAVDVSSDLDWLDDSALARSDSAVIKLDASFAPVPQATLDTSLTYCPQKLVIGVGCERGIDTESLIGHIRSVLETHSLAPEAIGMLASIDLKMDEAAIHAAAGHFDVPVRFFTAEELEAQKERLKTPSDVVFAEVGCHGVAEGAALAAAGVKGSLLVAKVKSDKATCAVGLAPQPFLSDFPGKKRGSLAVIGIGPGTPYWRSPQATSLIASAEKLVGYKFYLDLLGPMADDTRRCDFPMGSEKDRCRYALEEAGKGHDVALICSGDGGIYAMGALVMELLDRDADNGGVSDDAKRVALTHVPGISALQAASARFGALLGHDFCTISLSDLLTPWETIEQRIHAAADGDFVIAFYNPVSKKRRTQLLRAREILLAQRPETTPVLLASNLGRPDEELKMRTLATLDIEEVDMLTVVLVGSSQSRMWRSGDHTAGDDGWMAYTPRGYAKRIDGENRE